MGVLSVWVCGVSGRRIELAAESTERHRKKEWAFMSVWVCGVSGRRIELAAESTEGNRKTGGLGVGRLKSDP